MADGGHRPSRDLLGVAATLLQVTSGKPAGVKSHFSVAKKSIIVQEATVKEDDY